ncbi:unnamed protein product [Rotaria magnacalcarata]|uniref:Uncharacterized protein n=1 Tax=Rotaria magnacalcarata TaxID=392030 RepID=A0A816A5T1_9BILA|nr:unnamed protein product [Rotaria magnacalcarata]CAF1593375.1 unnamed protein product [Rotaria magnacalcarata]CAF2084756.1 unnamed protein product [Rotaria magnacalcarata]CAF3803785.1 unnamed protein product [Rotaria magnacalcarata]CAF4048242.1 unnamed protein product [Rotaria magnacalcarata]
MQQCMPLYLLWILCCSCSTNNYVLGCNASTDNWHDNILLRLLQTQCTTYSSFNEQQQHLSMDRSINNHIRDLPNFKPIKPYILLFIDRTHSFFILDELIRQAMRTKIFTIVPKINGTYANRLFLHIELIQHTQTIIVLIEYVDVIDKYSRYYYKLRIFFNIVLNSSKIIQRWGNLRHQSIPYTNNDLLSYPQISRAPLIDIQKEFKF